MAENANDEKQTNKRTKLLKTTFELNEYCCVPLRFLKFQEYQKEQQNTLSQISFAGQKEKEVVNQDSARRRNTVQSRERIQFQERASLWIW